MRIKIFILIGTVIALAICNSSIETPNPGKSTKNNSTKDVNSKNDSILYLIDKNSDFHDKIINLCVNEKVGETIELTEIYDSLSSEYLIVDSLEKVILVEKMKVQGFEVINWGRGNFPEGPRIIHYELKKGECICEVNKKYYSIDGCDNKWKMTESISCSEY